MTTITERLLARYGGRDLPPSLPWSPVLDQLLDHRSVRAFRDEPLPPGTLETLVAAAQSASTSSNLQLWSLVAVEWPATRERLAELAGGQAHIRQAPLFLVWLADLSRVERLAGRQAATLEAVPYLESLLLGTIDAALAAQNAVVALESLGLGGVYVGALRNRVDEVAELLQLPGHAYPVFGLSVGHPDPQRPAAIKPRLPQAAVLHREVYSSDGEERSIARYDERLGAFQREHGLPAGGWSGQVISRLGSVSALHGRERLSSILKALGFGLR